jgi:hypothetical protein
MIDPALELFHRLREHVLGRSFHFFAADFFALRHIKQRHWKL